MAGLETVMNAQIACSAGSSPASLKTDPIPIFVEGFIAGKIIDGVGGLNIPSFGVCAILEAPCAPATAVWSPGDPTVLMDGIPSLTQMSTCSCAVGGRVSILEPNNFTVFV